MKTNEDFSDRLKECGLKKTKHRVAVLGILSCSEIPVSADQIYIKLRSQEVAINLSTVYRTLETLKEKGLLIKYSGLNDNHALYEYNRLEHKHFLICKGCNKILSIVHCPLKEYEKTLEKETDFIITGHKLDMYGYCTECRNKGLQE